MRKQVGGGMEVTRADRWSRGCVNTGVAGHAAQVCYKWGIKHIKKWDHMYTGGTKMWMWRRWVSGAALVYECVCVQVWGNRQHRCGIRAWWTPLRSAEPHVSRSAATRCVFLLPQRRAIPKWHLHEKRPRSQNPGQFLNTWTIVYFHIDSQVSVGLLEVFPKRPLRSEIF